MEAFKEYLSASDYFLHIISLKNKQECFISIKTLGTADPVTKTGQKKRVRFTLLHNLWIIIITFPEKIGGRCFN